MNPISIIIGFLGLAAGAFLGYFYRRYQQERAAKSQQDKAESTLKVANEQARLIETHARESATKIVQAAESEIKERRIELGNESERLHKRRPEPAGRPEKREQRAHTLQSR